MSDEPAISPEHEASPRTGLVLMADDNPDHAELATLTLAAHPVVRRIACVADGVEALEYLFRTGRYRSNTDRELPSLMLLDLKLPRIDGLEVLQRIRAEAGFAALPVVVVTSSDEPEDLRRALRLGANGVIRKAIDMAIFADQLRRLATCWLA